MTPSAVALDLLLQEPIAAVRRRERCAFAEAAGAAAGRIVLVGGGGLGRRAQRGLRADDIEPLAFADNNPSRWDTDLDGTPVLRPADAVAQFPGAVFVVAIWGAGSPHRLAHARAQLHGLGADVIRPFAELAWAHADRLLPHYAMDLPSRLLEQADRVREAFGLLGDERSRREYVAQVRFRLTGDPDCLPPKDPGVHYLLPEIYRPASGEVVLDCGAYDGDTLAAWLAERGPTFSRYVAVEPDPASRERLERYLGTLEPEVRGRVTVLPYAVSDAEDVLTFASNGTASSAPVAGAGTETGTTVRALTLDSLADEIGLPPATFLKMDIEGAELDAVAGAAGIISSGQAVLALSAYHRQDHLWRLPLAVHALRDDLRLALRPHNEEGWDLVLYAVPPGRLP